MVNELKHILGILLIYGDQTSFVSIYKSLANGLLIILQ